MPIIFTLLWMLTVTPAAAHDLAWYEASCCHDQHCRPVDDGVVNEKTDGVWVDGYGILSYSDPRLRWSRDNNDHLCVNGTKLICVYRRPKGM